MSDAPKKVWLQNVGDADQLYDDEVTWCGEKINEDDVEYIRADEIERLRSACRKAWHELVEAGMGSTTTARYLQDALEADDEK